MEAETTYSLVRVWAGTAGLVLLVGLFIVVLVYALWPGNRKTFDHMAQLPLDDDEDGKTDKSGDLDRQETESRK